MAARKGAKSARKTPAAKTATAAKTAAAKDTREREAAEEEAAAKGRRQPRTYALDQGESIPAENDKE